MEIPNPFLPNAAASNAASSAPQLPPPPPVKNPLPYRPRAAQRKQLIRQLSSYWQSLKLSLVGLVYPPRCAICQEDLPQEIVVAAISPTDDWLCTPCVAKLQSATQRFCNCCAMPVPSSHVDTTSCSHCQQEKLLFSQARVLGVYHADLRTAVLQVKQPHQEPLATALGRLLAQQVVASALPRAPDAIVPIPMHWMKRLTRGTNAAESLAHGVAAVMQIPCQTDWLYLTRRVQKQGLLSPPERRKNMRGAMGTAADLKLGGRTILLVDDVLTTGATASDAARALLAAGAGAVYTCALARGTGADA